MHFSPSCLPAIGASLPRSFSQKPRSEILIPKTLQIFHQNAKLAHQSSRISLHPFPESQVGCMHSFILHQNQVTKRINAVNSKELQGSLVMETKKARTVLERQKVAYKTGQEEIVVKSSYSAWKVCFSRFSGIQLSWFSFSSAIFFYGRAGTGKGTKFNIVT